MPLRRDQHAGHLPENVAVSDFCLSVVQPTRKTLTTVYDALYGSYGPQHWWPGETPFEIMVGAVLTQNTAWTNVEKAIANLVAISQYRSGQLSIKNRGG